MNLEEIAKKIHDDIDDHCAIKYDDGLRSHLGASIIGEECLRRTWYGWRWIKREVFSGRMQRLFQSGHREEARFIEYLQGIGFNIHSVDPETQQQWKMSLIGGHYGGSLDSIGEAPHYFPEPLLLEFKTYNTKTFVSLKTEKVQKFRPRHYAQMCAYGRFMQLRYALYMAKNKNDDDLHIELLPLDWSYADELTRKAEYIITTKQPPQRISDLPAHWQCKYCFAHRICHYGDEPIARNCRSCIHATAIDGGKWLCEYYKQEIPEHFIEIGCVEGYRSII